MSDTLEASSALDWRFSAAMQREAQAFYDTHGFVGFVDLLGDEDVATLRAGYEELVESEGLDAATPITVNDAMLRHPSFAEVVTDPRIATIVERVLGRSVEVQHSKLKCKPLRDSGEGKIDWHQDYPFFPHTNFDLLAVAVHFDDEGEDEGPMEVLPGSHRRGPLTHIGLDGEFAYEVTEDVGDQRDAVPLTGHAGFVTMHHCLTLHSSAPKRSTKPRRILVTQYRAQDAAQIAGVIWRCGGYPVSAPPSSRMARFMDGTVVELRGRSGRLYDPFTRLAPDG